MKIESKTITKQVITKLIYQEGRVEWEIREARDGESVEVIEIITDQDIIKDRFNKQWVDEIFNCDGDDITAMIIVLDLNEGEMLTYFLDGNGYVKYKSN